jgi:hypothetical protein
MTMGQLLVYLSIGRQLVGLTLLFVAVFYLSRTASKPELRAA